MAEKKSIRELSDDLLRDLLIEAREQLEEIRFRRTHRTEKPEYRQRAKEAIGVIGHTVKMMGTRENARTNDLIEQRVLGHALPVADVRALPETS